LTFGQDPQAVLGVREGEILAGKYRVERVLGVGGMGIVVAARHIQLDERVALKFLLPQALGDEDAVARFLREARAAVKIKSEHIARVTDVGVLDNGAPYLVMEYLEGGDLAGWLKQRGPLPVEQAVDFVIQACVAVAEAHALGIIHRDLKPSNLFCVRRLDGQLSIRVLDFGISKRTDMSGTATAMGMTRTGALMGSPFYMSPEQMRSSKDVDATTDIWALGITLFELIAGRPVFVAQTVTELAIQVANEPPPSLRTFRPDAPSGLDAVISRCLEKDRRRRYPNIGELAVALLPFAPKRAKTMVERISGTVQSAGLSASAPAVTASPPPGDTQASAGTLPPFGRTTQGTSRRTSAVLGIGGLVLIAIAVGGAFVFLSKKTPAPLDAPPATATQAAAAPLVSQSSITLAPPQAAVATLPAPPAASSASPPVTVVPTPTPAATTKKGNSPGKGNAPPTPAAATSPSAAPAPAPAPKATVNCDPPYYFDARGNRTFKPECL
jgi:serine/threonine-protein kinase